MKKNDKKYLWRGLTATLAPVTAVLIVLTNLMFLYKGNVDLVMGTTPDLVETTDDTNYFPSKYGALNAENLEKLLADEKAFNVQVQEEGSVLVKNNGALPLKGEERAVTLFGKSTADPLYRGASGGSGFSAKRGISLKKALENEGFRVNETMFKAYASSTTKRTTAEAEGASIGEEQIDFYNSSLKDSYASDYNDVAIVMFTRVSGEGNDMNVKDADGVPELSLHQQEKDLLKMIKDSGKFKKTVVLINSGNPMDLGWLDEAEYGVDACLWIGLPGNYGFEGVANVLTGKSDVTGHFVDTYATNSLSSPAMQNFGHNYFTNSDKKYQREYVVYAENIYVGYKYYETRYQDQVLGINNANSSAGVFASKGGWNYAEEMAYPFGYGTSYSDFTQEVESITWDRSAHMLTAEVKVTNNGSDAYSGASKSTVQLYAQLPYIEGGVEKSAIQLVGFAKSGILKAGESETVKVEVSDYHFATYDETRTNGADPSKTGCYVFDEGDYYFAVGDDCHDALNNVLAARGVSGLFDEKGNSVEGDPSKAVKDTLTASDNTTYATSPYTDEVVSNQFADVNINYFQKDAVQYLTRADWNTFPKTAVLSVTDEMKKLLDANTYVKSPDAPSAKQTFETSADNGLSLVDLRQADFNDERWDLLIDQMTMRELAANTADQLGSNAVSSIGKPKMASCDGPDGISGTYKVGSGDTGTCYVCEVVLSSTYNVELSKARGEFMAEDALYLGVSWVWGPGADHHRHPYGGRNFEYYSEDGNLAYMISAPQLKAMQDGGLISGLKHFVLNDQEIDRHGISTFLTEQALRENNLRSFEGALATNSALGVMSAFNRIGCTPTMQSVSLLTNVLRKEWGFIGVCITDASQDGADYMRTYEGVIAGSDVWCMDQLRIDPLLTQIRNNDDGTVMEYLRLANKRFLYAASRSNAMNGLSSHTKVSSSVSWWQPAMIVIDCVFGAVALGCLVMTVLSAHVFSRKEG
ncbi:MAG: glycoside hydrolase family 3 C-terminal domain-containing protein [Clostridia bacterium]|nr:glycoside hydrolase family 3 C-terminal domain-containing protein [Clostridia bacterium]